MHRGTSPNATNAKGMQVSPTNDLDTTWYDLMTPEMNNVELANDLDTVEELRDNALIGMAAYRNIIAKSFNKNVKAKMFQVGDWVLRKTFQNTQEGNAGKLGQAGKAHSRSNA